jgi:fluoride exporter
MTRFLLVCLGSAVGGGARYLLSSWLTERWGSQLPYGTVFPYGTFVVNVIGSFLIGGLMYAGGEGALLSAAALLTLTTGVMGGFTTYSAFSYQTLKALQDGHWAVALANVALTVFGCLLACSLGWYAARSMWSPTA